MKQLEQIELSSDTRNGSEQADAPPAYDDVLREIGEFGPYQILVGSIVGFVFAYGSFITMNFIFGVDTVEHRCWIPECEPSNSDNFSADWLERAIPYRGGRPDSCTRFALIDSANGTCSEHNFNRSQLISCDGFILKNNEQRLLSHLSMLCTGQSNKLTLLGTANMLGRTIAMPVSGYIADRCGRLITITVSATLGAICSVLQALPSRLMTFELYLALEFLASLLSTGMIAAGFVYNMEWTTAKYRVRINTISIMSEDLIPYVAISLVAWYYSDNFVAYRLALTLPGFLALAFHFVLAESPQWLLAQNKTDRAIGSLSKAARINGESLNAHTIRRLEQFAALTSNESTDGQVANVSMMDLLRQKALAFRLLIVSLAWVCMYFAYYGIFFESTKVHENKYLSFALIGFADIPGGMINELLLNRIGRRLTIGMALPIFSAMLLASTQLSADQETVQLILFVVGKVAVTTACNGYHTFSTEFWPTAIRGTASNISTTAAQMGGILASVAILLDGDYANLPVFLSAAAGILGTVLVFAFLPETMHCDKLPDTIEEALAIGRPSKR